MQSSGTLPLALVCAIAYGIAVGGLHARTNTAQTSIAALAAQLRPGQWAELKTANFAKSLLETPGAGYITNFSEDAVWNPNTKELYFLGAGHGDQSSGELTRFIKYSADANAWSVLPLPRELFEIGHSYDHNAIDPATGEFYHRIYFTREVRKFDPVRGEWKLLPPWPSGFQISITGALEYFPEMGGLIYTNGSSKESDGGYALFFDRQKNKWSVLKEGLHFGDYHTFSEYNPIHHVVVFGGGEWNQKGESREMYKIDAAGKVAKLKDAPLDLGTHETIFTVDPVSGHYLILGRDRSFWQYNVMADEWAELKASVPLFADTSRDNPIKGTIATPVSSHGVVMFVSYPAMKVYLYKHR